MNGGGCGFRVGNFSSGSPVIFHTILNLSGSSPTTGLTLSATGLYFFLVTAKVSAVLYEALSKGTGSGWGVSSFIRWFG